MGASLLLDGDIELLADIEEDDGYKFEALSTTKRGNPVPVEVTLASFLRDGSIVSKTGDENREMVLPVRVTGADLLVLALGEKRLNLATGKRTTLVWTPHDGIGPATVFDVLTSSLEEPQDDGWDLAEVHNRRTYNLRLVCLPFGRSVDKITDDAGAPPTSGTIEDSCDSATGWASPANASSGLGSVAPAVDTVIKAEGTGSVKCQAYSRSYLYESGSAQDYTIARNLDVKTLSVATGAGGYLSVLIRVDWPGYVTDVTSGVESIKQKTAAGGATQTAVAFAAVETLADGWVRYAWPVAAGETVTELEFNITQAKSFHMDASVPFIHYDAITLSTAASTDNQIVKVLEVEGSARTTGSLHVGSPDDGVALGIVLAATVSEADVPAGFRPDVRRWVTSGSTSVDATAMHGSVYTGVATYTSSPQFELPCTAFAPGNYSVVALVKSGSGNTVGVEAQLTVGGVADGLPSTAEATVAGSVDWVMAPLGTVRLAAISSPTSAAEYRLRFKGNAVLLDEIFLIPEAADFTIADCGSSAVGAGGSASHLWIDSPSAAQPMGGWWRGYAADRVNARRVNLVSELRKPGLHIFKPGRLLAFVAATEAAGPTVALDYYPHWLNNACL